jgi:signal peptidase I
MKPDISRRVISNDQFYLLMTSVLEKGKSIRFNAKGGSMSPFFKDGDTLTIAPLGNRSIALGDVLAFNHPDRKELLVHRVVAQKKDRFLMKADNGCFPDGWVSPVDVIGILAAVQRGRRKIYLSLGWEKHLIAHLSRRNLLLASLRFFWRLTPALLKKKLH